MTPPRIGFLGAGLIATYHSKSLRRSGVDVVRAGVFDPDAERSAAFAAASGHVVMPDETSVLDSCDAVYVCTWTSEHPRLVAEAARRGIHVFCEKPLAFDTDTARRMADAVTEAGVVHQVGLVLRHSPAFLRAHELVTDPAAGRVMSVVFRDDQFIPVQGHYASTWRGDPTKAGAGTLLEHSIHDVDMIRFLVGEVAAVNGRVAYHHGIAGIEDVTSALLHFESGATGTLTSVWHDNLARPSLRRVEVFCERRHVVVDGDDWFGPVTWTDADGSTGTFDATGAPFANPDGEFVRAIAEARPASPGFDEAVAAHRIVDAVYRSARADGATETP